MDSHELVLSRRVRNACTIATTIQVRHGRVYVGLATCVLGMSFGIITVPGSPRRDGGWSFFRQSAMAILSGVVTGMLVGGAS
jgi:hypothetical protein